MDVSFSAWRQTREESLVLKLDSFAFLFDRRYTNRLNRMSRVFFEAYVKATKELAAQEDRFPSLSEIDAKMESGAVYAFKDRLMKNTEFFEEVKISGVSYLVPRALRFIDASGTYTDLAFDFDAGTAVLPTRRKIPAPVETQPSNEEIAAAETPQEIPPEASALQETEVSEVEAYPGHEPEPYAEVEEAVAAAKPEPAIVARPEPVATERPQEGTTNVQPPKGRSIPAIAIVVAVIAVLLAAGGYFLVSLPPPGAPSMVMYSAYLSNVSNETYLGLDIKNPNSITDELEMVLPPDIDRSISAQGGVVTISHSSSTIVRLNSSHDASIRIYLSGNWTSVPVTLSLDVPKGFDSGLVVHGKDYNVERKDSTILLKFDATREGTSFEQSYTRKR